MGLSRIQKTLLAKGFSLIELMVAVSIMGVLVAIAVPQYQRSQARAFHAGAQSALSTLYMHEQNFYYEWDVYVGDFGPLDFIPTGTYYYDLGFAPDDRGLCGTDILVSADMTIDELCNGAATAPDFPSRRYTGALTSRRSRMNLIGLYCSNRTNNTCDYLGEGHRNGVSKVQSDLLTGDPDLVTTNTFVIPALGMTPTNGEEERDFWAINHYKVVCHNTLADESSLTAARSWLEDFVMGSEGCQNDL